LGNEMNLVFKIEENINKRYAAHTKRY